MTHEKSYLRVNKLVVIAHEGIALNLDFHTGVNIIRGDNGSGKSTIMDFLFYGLGGDYVDWKPEALQCDCVYLEVLINKAPTVLRRYVSKKRMQDMHVFWGSYSEMEKAAPTDWNVFPFKRSANKKSFSQILFSAIGLPEVWGDHDSNITMHQLLRVLYMDQLSSVQSLIREEKFDAPLTRETIAELLLGLYDKDLYVDQLELGKKKKKKEQVKSQLKVFSAVFESVDQAGDSYEFLEAQMEESKRQLVLVQEEINNADMNVDKGKAEVDDSALKGLKSNYATLRNSLNKREEEVTSLKFQRVDSADFLAALKMRIDALDDALLVKKMLSEDFLKLCPACMQPVAIHVDGDDCFLCKQPLDKEKTKSDLLRMRQELVFQEKESEKLHAEREEKLIALKSSVRILCIELELAKSNLEASLDTVKTTRSAVKDALHEKKGNLESQIDALLPRMKVFLVQRELDERHKTLVGEITSLETRIGRARSRHTHRTIEIYDVIKKYAKELLEADLPREAEFQRVDDVKIDFRLNTFAVNQKNNFSASSIFYLKNCIHYALFFTAQELDYVRYPRLLLCDNMEDKGMEQERSHNFQKQIIDMTTKLDGEHQIIFSTSMIHPDLEDTELCVGPHFTESHKALQNV